jgi:AraC-like DNA-binding protein
MKEELLVSLKQICDFMLEYNQDKNKNKNKIVEKVRALVDENYLDVNLNVSTLADQIGMNSKYIATVYKEATSESILELINRIRIEKAKILLEKGMTIAQTAQMVGFSNSNALIRAFKKFEGITPGQYKESL